MAFFRCHERWDLPAEPQAARQIKSRAERTRRGLARLAASNIGVNQLAPSMPDAPLGGLGDSAYGYEGGRDGVAAFQHLRRVSETPSAA